MCEPPSAWLKSRLNTPQPMELEIIRSSLQRVVLDQGRIANLRFKVDPLLSAGNDMVLTLTAELLARKMPSSHLVTDYEQVPLTWRDHLAHRLKSRWPRLFSRLRPVYRRIPRHTQVNHYNVCPHLSKSHYGQHLLFLYDGPPFGDGPLPND